MDAQIEVTLISPAKVDGEHKPVGATVFVSEKVLHQLAAAGAVPELAVIDGEIEVIPSAFEEAVAVKAQEIATEMVAVAIPEAVEDLVDQLKKAVARGNLLQEERDAVENGRNQMAGRAEAAEARVAELEQQISKAAVEDTPPEPVPETNNKKADAEGGKKTASKPKS